MNVKTLLTGSAAFVLGATGALAHPLDGLTPDEYGQINEILRGADIASDDTLYPLIELIEPPKSEVLAWEQGEEVDRRAMVHMTAPDGDGFIEATVNLTDGEVEGTEPVSGQPMILFQEFISAMEAALSHPDMVSGLESRGLTPDDVFCLPLTAGNFFSGEEDGNRLMKVPCYVNPTGSNFYAKPVEGLFAVVDLNSGEALRIVDEGNVPIPEDPWGYTEEEIAERMALRPVTNPAKVDQEGEPNYTIDGSQIEWDIWRFRHRIDKRPGPVLSQIQVQDSDEWRSVLYQAHLSEVFVPYMDPTAGMYWRTYMDSGEYGFGLFLTPLTPGVDCPAYATYMPAVIADDAGNPLEIPDAICIFERNIGDPAWRHFEVFAQTPENFVPAEGRPATELVYRTASEVGNYDYLIDYRFKQNGEMKIMIGATGLDAVKGVATTHLDDDTAEEDTKWGTLIAPNLVASNHDHYFNFRLDFDVDQPVNEFATLDIVPAEVPADSPRTSMWTVEENVPDSELDARYRISAMEPRYFTLYNRDREGPLGHNPSYLIHHGNIAYGPFDFENDPPMKRNAYIEYSVWNTVYDPEQRYAGGKFAMQSDGSDTLAEWVKADKPLAGEDIVTWFTAGFHHIPRLEDWPVMSTDWKTVHIIPNNFFSLNPAINLRKD
ncbi:copper amine oxidase [Tranquillimonas alkanivorans]|uniref:Amine oxidase n=1 Tax=Tranquillimonas alkanivorans TaxID=441119 RepID=A0A1I5NNJ8_9RHOB|nr:tyramine oxidase [Tranquillimonas alkanivorans]SFP23312.1 primary-amine oxidase [Tranquillimonas alkanivorans]